MLRQVADILRVAFRQILPAYHLRRRRVFRHAFDFAYRQLRCREFYFADAARRCRALFRFMADAIRFHFAMRYCLR